MITRVLDLEIAPRSTVPQNVELLRLVIESECERLADDIAGRAKDLAHLFTSGRVVASRISVSEQWIQTILVRGICDVRISARLFSPGFHDVVMATVRFLSSSPSMANIASYRLAEIGEELTNLRVLHVCRPKAEPDGPRVQPTEVLS